MSVLQSARADGDGMRRPDERLLCMCCMRGLRHGVFFDKVQLLCLFGKASTGFYLKAREKMFYQLRLVLALEHILSRTTPRRQRPS